MCTFMQVQALAQVQVQLGKYHGLVTAQYVPSRCGWPPHLNRKLRRGLQLETPRLALQQTLVGGGVGAGGWW